MVAATVQAMDGGDTAKRGSVDVPAGPPVGPEASASNIVCADPELHGFRTGPGRRSRGPSPESMPWILTTPSRWLPPAAPRPGSRTVTPFHIKHAPDSNAPAESRPPPPELAVSDRDRAEGQVHQALAASRVNPSKEFFLAPVTTVLRALDEAAGHWPIQLGRTPRAGLLEPALMPRVVACHHCGGRIKAPRLLVSVQVNCGHCSRSFEMASDVRG